MLKIFMIMRLANTSRKTNIKFIVSGLDISNNVDIIYRIQQNTEEIISIFSDYISSHIELGDIVNLVIGTSQQEGNINGLFELKGGFPDGDGINYALLFYLVLLNIHL